MKSLLPLFLLSVPLIAEEPNDDSNSIFSSMDRLSSKAVHTQLSNYNPFIGNSGTLSNDSTVVYLSNNNLFYSKRVNSKFSFAVGSGSSFENYRPSLGDFHSFSDPLRDSVEAKLGLSVPSITIYGDGDSDGPTSAQYKNLPSAYFDGYGDTFIWFVDEEKNVSSSRYLRSTQLITNFDITDNATLSLSLSPTLERGSFKSESRLVTTFRDAPNQNISKNDTLFMFNKSDTLIYSSMKPVADLFQKSLGYASIGVNFTPSIILSKNRDRSVYFKNPVQFNKITTESVTSRSTDIGYRHFKYSSWDNNGEDVLFPMSDSLIPFEADRIDESIFIMSHHLGYEKRDNSYDNWWRLLIPFVANNHSGEIFYRHVHDDSEKDLFTAHDSSEIGINYYSFKKIATNRKFLTGIDQATDLTVRINLGDDKKEFVATPTIFTRFYFLNIITLDLAQSARTGVIHEEFASDSSRTDPIFAPSVAAWIGGIYRGDTFGISARVGGGEIDGAFSIDKNSFEISAWLFK